MPDTASAIFGPADANGYAEPHHHLVGRNPGGWKVHLVEPQPYNRTALCGMNVDGTGSGATLKPHGRSYLCKACEKVALAASEKR